jgi:hypothetical protein
VVRRDKGRVTKKSQQKSVVLFFFTHENRSTKSHNRNWAKWPSRVERVEPGRRAIEPSRLRKQIESVAQKVIQSMSRPANRSNSMSRTRSNRWDGASIQSTGVGSGDQRADDRRRLRARSKKLQDEPADPVTRNRWNPGAGSQSNRWSLGVSSRSRIEEEVAARVGAAPNGHPNPSTT